MLKIFSGRMNSKTAGLSPNNDERIELFLGGCKKARDGNACPGCFNQDLWSGEGCYEQTPEDVLKYLKMTSDNKYITIVGGEPLDQYDDLSELLKLLNQDGYHTVIITHHDFKHVVKKYPDVLKYADMVIDGEYKQEKRIFDTDTRSGINHVVGSYNQRIWYHHKNDVAHPARNSWQDISKMKNFRPYYQGDVA